MNEDRGWYHPEFWVTVGGGVLMLLMPLLHLTPDQVADGNAWIGKTAVAVVGLVGFIISVWRYLHSRTEVVKSDNEKEAALHAANVSAQAMPEMKASSLYGLPGSVGMMDSRGEESCCEIGCPKQKKNV